MGTRGTGERGGTVAFEKAPQNFYEKDGHGYSLCKSDCSPVWFLYRLEYRLLYGFSTHPTNDNEKSAIPCLNDIVSHFFCFHYLMEKNEGAKPNCPVAVFHHYPIHEIPQSLPQKGILPPHSKLYPAISFRRVRIPPGAARERSSHAKDGTKLVSSRTCTNSTHQPFS